MSLFATRSITRAVRYFFLASAAMVLTFSQGAVTPAFGEAPFEREPINYLEAEPNDPITHLQRQLDKGETKLQFDENFGYLPSVLKALNIDTSSQMLVFSKTSFQLRRISPATPRAVYFNDVAYIGWVQHGDVMEVSTVDPQLGAIYYTLEQRPADKPKFTRRTHECLQCHASSLTHGVPGHLVRSVYPDTKGYPILSAGTFRTSQQSPLEERWGGWYVSGTHAGHQHMGNQCVENDADPQELDRAVGADVTDLSKLFDVDDYLTPHSDIVALMVLEHQVDMHNLITQANYDTRRALFDGQIINRMLERSEEFVSESTVRRIKNAGEPLLEQLLMVGETELKGPIKGTSKFADDYVATGRQDAKGRSLRELDLKSRLFRYRCSPLVYSEAFDQLPKAAKDYVYRRLFEILTGKDASDRFASLAAQQRQDILAILRGTKMDLPDYWRVAAKSP